MTSEKSIKIAAAVLAEASRLAPDRIPKAAPETCKSWGRVIEEIYIPDPVWADVPAVWALEYVSDRMLTPKELKDAAHTAYQRWESGAYGVEKRAWVRDYRAERQRALEQSIEDGSFQASHQLSPSPDAEPTQKRSETARRGAEIIRQLQLRQRGNQTA